MNTVQTDRKMLREMLTAACHFGHRTSKWNPKMKKYLYGSRDNVHIIDLSKSYESLMKAMDFVKEQVSKGKTVLFVCTKLHAKGLIEEAGRKTAMPYVIHKWIPGLLTNYKTIRQRIRYLRDLKTQRDKGEFEKYTKKEKGNLMKKIESLEGALGGVEEMLKLPDILFVADCMRDKNAIREANKLEIPIVGIVDSNADPSLITYPIPGNDDAVKSLAFFINKVAEAVLEGKKKQTA